MKQTKIEPITGTKYVVEREERLSIVYMNSNLGIDNHTFTLFTLLSTH